MVDRSSSNSTSVSLSRKPTAVEKLIHKIHFKYHHFQPPSERGSESGVVKGGYLLFLPDGRTFCGKCNHFSKANTVQSVQARSRRYVCPNCEHSAAKNFKPPRDNVCKVCGVATLEDPPFTKCACYATYCEDLEKAFPDIPRSVLVRTRAEWRRITNLSRDKDGSERVNRYGEIPVCEDWLDEEKFTRFLFKRGWIPGTCLDPVFRSMGYMPSNCLLVPKGNLSMTTAEMKHLFYSKKPRGLRWPKGM